MSASCVPNTLPRHAAESVYFELLTLRACGEAPTLRADLAEYLIEASPGVSRADRLDAAIACLREYLHGPTEPRSVAPFALGTIERAARLRELFVEIQEQQTRPFDEAAIRKAACAALARLNQPARRRAVRRQGARL